MTPDSQFAPLPVRRLGTLEILDTALKLYRRYLGVLLGWSALVSLTWLVSFVVSFAYLLAIPLIYGSVACCIAAAVRGQKVSFSQVWEFTKPRFGPLLGVVFVSGLIFSLAIFVVSIAATLLFIAGAYVLDAASLPEVFNVIVAIIGFLAALVLTSLLSMMAFGWLNMVPIVACLEDDKRGMAAMGRAWDLMRGHWKKIFGVSTLLTLSIFVVFGIIAGLLGALGFGLNIFTDEPSELAIFGLIAGFSGMIGLFFLFWNPAQAMVVAVLYLDLRVRKEALDLEWNAYASAPPPPSETPSELNTSPAAAAMIEQLRTSEVAPVNVSPSAFGAGAAMIAPAPNDIAEAKSADVNFLAAPADPEIAISNTQIAPVVLPASLEAPSDLPPTESDSAVPLLTDSALSAPTELPSFGTLPTFEPIEITPVADASIPDVAAPTSSFAPSIPTASLAPDVPPAPSSDETRS